MAVRVPCFVVYTHVRVVRVLVRVVPVTVAVVEPLATVTGGGILLGGNMDVSQLVSKLLWNAEVGEGIDLVVAVDVMTVVSVSVIVKAVE